LLLRAGDGNSNGADPGVIEGKPAAPRSYRCAAVPPVEQRRDGPAAPAYDKALTWTQSHLCGKLSSTAGPAAPDEEQVKVDHIPGSAIEPPAPDPLTRPDNPLLQRDGLLVRIAPFAGLAVIAEASLLLPPGPASLPDAIVSVLLLVAVAAEIVFVPWPRVPGWLTVTVPLLYTASILFLIQGAGGSTSGVGIVLLSPLIWAALFHRRWETALVAVAVLGVMLYVSLNPDMATTSVLIRRMFFWSALATMIAFVGHGLRHRVRRSRQETAQVQDRLREMSILADRDRIASSLHDTVVQRLFAAGLALQGVALRAARPDLTSRIDEVVQNLDDSITLLRESIFALEGGQPQRDPVDQEPAGPAEPAAGSPPDPGLRRSILDVVSELTPGIGVIPEITLDGPLDTAVPGPVAHHLLDSLREVLGYSDEHRQPGRVAVAVTVDGMAVTLTITEDGPWWAEASTADSAELALLHRRASQFGGTVTARPAADGMSQLSWRAPLAVEIPLSAGLPLTDQAQQPARMIPRGAPSR
jgi:signal transduction histidine kinase